LRLLGRNLTKMQERPVDLKCRIGRGSMQADYCNTVGDICE
jgi:hypothetical protein